MFGKFFLLDVLLPGVLSLLFFQAIFKPQSKALLLEPKIGDIVTSTTVDAFEIHKPFASITTDISDYRVLTLNKYFAKYNSPLAGYGALFVEMCDKYKLPYDCTLIPAIAYAETKLCTLANSASIFNCWGWGGSGSNRSVYKSYQDSIEAMSKNLMNGYGKILSQPDLIVDHYCGGHCETWAPAVKGQQKAIKDLAKQMGFPAL